MRRGKQKTVSKKRTPYKIVIQKAKIIHVHKFHTVISLESTSNIMGTDIQRGYWQTHQSNLKMRLFVKILLNNAGG